MIYLEAEYQGKPPSIIKRPRSFTSIKSEGQECKHVVKGRVTVGGGGKDETDNGG
jgi:hypothetical protein